MFSPSVQVKKVNSLQQQATKHDDICILCMQIPMFGTSIYSSSMAAPVCDGIATCLNVCIKHIRCLKFFSYA